MKGLFRYFTFAISLRYIRTRMITWFSILGVALGVMVLIIVLSVMDGFRQEFTVRLQGVLSHLIVNVRFNTTKYEVTEKEILSAPHVQECSPHLRGVVLMASKLYYAGGMVMGIDYEKEFKVSKLQDYLVTAHKEVQLWAEQLLEDNIRNPTWTKIEWTVLRGGEVEQQGRFPAGTRIVCQRTSTLKSKDTKPWWDIFASKQINTPTEYATKEFFAYTIKDQKIIFIEEFPNEEEALKVTKLSSEVQVQWQKFFDAMGKSLENRKLQDFTRYFSTELRLSGGSIDPQKPFTYISLDPDERTDNIRPIIIGYEIMRQLDLKYGDEFTLITGHKSSKDEKLNAFSRKFIIVGAFKSGWQEVDAHIVYTRRDDLRDFLLMDVNEISVQLDDYKNADIAKATLEKNLNKEYVYPRPYYVQKWEELRKSLLSAIRLERLVMIIIVSLIVILAVVSIMIILILLVTEKTKDIGILKAMGASKNGIMGIFLFNGLFISFFGSLLGSGAGIWFCLKINTFADFIFEMTGFRLFPRDVYYLDRIPAELSMYTVGVIMLTTWILTILFCLIPAYKAARLDPIAALNSESLSLKWRTHKHTETYGVTTNNIFFGAENLAKEYIMGTQKLRVFEKLSMEVHPGEILVILGASGVGKSTLLHILGLLDTPTAGAVFHKGVNLSTYNSNQQARIRNREFGFVFQLYHLLPEFTALENVLLAAMIRYNIWDWPSKKSNMLAYATELLDKVGLSQRMHHRPIELSGGERQRVAIARALMLKPKIVLCDEPTGNLDENTSLSIQNLILDLNQKLGQTFVIVTHEERIARRGTRVFRLEHGTLNPVHFPSLIDVNDENLPKKA